MLNEKDQVVIARGILQDQDYKTNHFLLVRIIESHEIGYIREMDREKSEETMLNYYWAQFQVAAIRIGEKYLIKPEDF